MPLVLVVVDFIFATSLPPLSLLQIHMPLPRSSHLFERTCLFENSNIRTNMENSQEPLQKSHILLIPYPAQGHMLPLLDLAHHLSRRHSNLTISIAITPKNLHILSPLLNSCSSIQPVIFPFPNYPSLPSNVENTKDVAPSKASFSFIMHALSYLHKPIVEWANSISTPPLAIISDFFMGWTNNVAEELEIPRITFCPSGALTLCISNDMWLNMPEEGPTLRFESLPGSPEFKWDHLSSLYRAHKKGSPMSEFIRENFLANLKGWGFVFNSFEGLEKVYLDHMKKDLGHDRIWAVGPLNLLGPQSIEERGGPNSVPAEDLMAWLDGKEEGSVVYVCFGSQAELTEAQVAALADGLEKSGVRFVWCMRAGSVGPEEEFVERVKERGLVVKGWVPQVSVLGHPSVGTFVTHCGWNSVLEGITGGTVMLTWPMGADQFYNARLLEEEVRIGVRVCEGSESVPDPDELAKLLRDGREEMRVRARDLRDVAVEATGDGGSSWRDVDDMIEKICRFDLDV